MILTLIGFVIADYVTGVACAWVEKKINSEVGAKGIAKKVLIFVLVGLAAALDKNYLNGQPVLRAAVISFFVANEGISIIENAGRLGLPIPEKLKNALEQLKGGKDEDIS
jgi:toxin secretion/phage lysis holin